MNWYLFIQIAVLLATTIACMQAARAPGRAVRSEVAGNPLELDAARRPKAVRRRVCSGARVWEELAGADLKLDIRNGWKACPHVRNVHDVDAHSNSAE